jgi:membrane protease YdiL (CAAX protease family)
VKETKSLKTRMNHGNSSRFSAYMGFALLLGLALTLAFGTRLGFLTLLTYFLMPSQPRLQDLSDAASALGIFPAALVSVGGVALLRFITPFPRDYNRGYAPWPQLRSQFSPGLLQGLAVGFGLALAFSLSGLYQLQSGWPAQGEGLGAMLSLGMRASALVLMVYCEELFFRKILLERFARLEGALLPAVCVALGYCAYKEVQFELAWMQRLTLLLLSFSLTFAALHRKDWLRGTGVYAGFLLITHLGFGLPVFASEGGGLFMLQYTGGADRLAVALTGGLGGPLSSLATQALLCAALLRGFRRLKAPASNTPV